MWLGQGPCVLWDIASSENGLIDVTRPFSLRGWTTLLSAPARPSHIAPLGQPAVGSSVDGT